MFAKYETSPWHENGWCLEQKSTGLHSRESWASCEATCTKAPTQRALRYPWQQGGSISFNLPNNKPIRKTFCKTLHIWHLATYNVHTILKQGSLLYTSVKGGRDWWQQILSVNNFLFCKGRTCHVYDCHTWWHATFLVLQNQVCTGFRCSLQIQHFSVLLPLISLPGELNQFCQSCRVKIMEVNCTT